MPSCEICEENLAKHALGSFKITYPSIVQAIRETLYCAREGVGGPCHECRANDKVICGELLAHVKQTHPEIFTLALLTPQELPEP